MRKERSNKLLLGALIVILAIFIFFEPSYGWKVREFFSAYATPAGVDASTSIAAENETLKAELANLQVVAAELPAAPANDIRAMVYSRYPLNFKNELLINAGAESGVTTGTAVIYQGIFIGQVEQVFENTALVRTVFDDSLKLPVRIGNNGYDGLLEGGPDPSVGSIAKTSVILPGDIIYAAAPGVPYGVPVGEVSATSTSEDSLFQTASINFAYDINDIQTVLVVK